jgi:hypothetical protein
MSEVLVPGKPLRNIDEIPCGTEDPAVMPLEHLEARICELAGHINAATCKFLLLVADFDARGGWASWEMPSCAAWLSWKCQIAPGTAREHVRAARALTAFPLIRQEFAAARLSYAKVRALTRIVTPQTEKDLVEMAMPMTAAQLERFARAHRQVTRGGQDAPPAARPMRLSWRHDTTGISLSVQLPPAEGAVVLQALRAYVNDVDHPHGPGPGPGDGDGDGQDRHPAGQPGARTRQERLRDQDAERGVDWGGDKFSLPDGRMPGEDLAGALAGIFGEYLAGRAASAENPDNYHVVIHAGTGALTAAPEPVPAETPTPSQRALEMLKETVPLLSFPEGHPAFPWRCHVEDGHAVDAATLRMIACNSTLSAMLHDETGKALNAGRRSRKASARLRRAVRDRDRYRCRFPGCESRRIDLHHIQFWANGGETSLDNLLCLCKRHHRIVHDKGILIAAAGNGFTFYLPDGALISNSPPLPAGSAEAIAGCHDAEVSYATIVPPYSGERLDLHEAIWVCFTSARNQAASTEQEACGQAA